MLPATVFWTNPDGGDWATPGNWSTGALPGSADDVVIDLPGPLTVTHSTGADVIRSLTSRDDVALTGGSLALAAPSLLGSALVVSGGTLTGGGDVTVDGMLTWTGGTLTGSGDTVANGGLVIDGSAPKLLDGRTLENVGSATWMGQGTLTGQNGAALVNRPGARFLAQSDATFDSPSSGAAFNNAGTFRKTGASGVTTFHAQFNNAGTVEVRAGTVSFTNGGSSSGAFQVAAGATLEFGLGTHTLGRDSSITGAGTVRIRGGQAGVTHFLGTYGVTGATVIASGTFDVVDNLELSSLTLNGGTLAAVANVSVTGLFSWSDGTVRGPGTVTSAGRLDLRGGEVDGVTFDNAGTAAVTGGLYAINGAVVNNLAGATFDIQADTTFQGSMFGLPAAFNNAGLLRKSVGNATTVFAIPLNNNGTVDVQAGTLQLSGADSNGTFTVEAEATLFFFAHVLGPMSRVSGAGTVQLGPGAVHVRTSFDVTGIIRITGQVFIDADVTMPSVLLSSDGALAGMGTLTVTGVLTWSGGNMWDNGRTIALGGLVINGSGQLLNRTIDSPLQTTLLLGANIVGNSGVFNNPAGATFDIQGDVTWNGPTVFNNSGTIRKSAGGAVATLSTTLNNSGTVAVDSGTLALVGYGTSSGAFRTGMGTTLTFGVGTHTLTAGSQVTGPGDVNITGTVHALGLYNVSGSTSVSGSGIADFATDSTLGRLNLGVGGTLTGSGNVTVTGLFTWTSGTVTGIGQLLAQSGLSLNGTASSPPPTLDGRTLANAGAGTWTGSANLVLSNGAVINNLSTGTFVVQSTATLVLRGSDTINNAGTFQKSSGNALLTLGVLFNNSGTVAVDSGTLSLTGGGTDSGTFTMASEATLTFAGGVHNLTATSQLTGAGDVVFRQDTVHVLGRYNSLGETMVNGGTVDFTHDATLARLTCTVGTLTGTGTVTVTELLTWTGGTMNGAGRTRSEGNLSLSGTGSFGPATLDGRTFDNAGKATWTGTIDLAFGDGATFNNLAGAVFDIRNDRTMFQDRYVPPRPFFNNAGTFRKSAGNSFTLVGVAFNNTGTVKVRTGSLSLSAGGTGSGTFTAGKRGTLYFAQVGYELGPSSHITGAGTVAFDGSGFSPTFTVAGTYDVSGPTLVLGAGVGGAAVDFTHPVTLAQLSMSNGSIADSGQITITGLFTWIGGSLFGPGRVRVDGTLNIKGSGLISDPSLSTELDIINTGIWTSGNLRMGATLEILSGATLDIRGNGNAIGGGTLQNDGTLHVSRGSLRSSLFSNSGTVVVQEGILWLCNGASTGALTVMAGSEVIFGDAGSYTLLPSSSVTGAGSVSVGGTPSPANLTVAGTYQLDGDTSIDGTVNFVSNATTGTATLNRYSTLTGVGDFTVTRRLTWAGGTMSGPGRTFVNGSLAISGGKLDGRVLNNAGTATWTGLGDFALGNGAVFNNLAGATLETQTDVTLSTFGSSPTFNNQGMFRKSAGAGTTTTAVRFTNTGTVDVETGTLDFTGAFTNFSADTATLTGGTYRIGGVLQFNAANIAFNAATVVLDGPAARIINQAGQDALARFATNTSVGNFTLQNGASLTATGDFTNAGSISVTNGSTFTTSGTYTQSGGLTTLGDSVLAADTVDVEGGTLSGTGTIDASVMMAGELDVGVAGSPGVLTITGDYAQTGVLVIEIGGTTPGVDFDQLHVSGRATFAGGTLTIRLINGFFPDPSVPDTFPIITFGRHDSTDDFAVYNGLDLGDGLYLAPVFDDAGLTLVTMQTMPDRSRTGPGAEEVGLSEQDGRSSLPPPERGIMEIRAAEQSEQLRLTQDDCWTGLFPFEDS